VYRYTHMDGPPDRARPGKRVLAPYEPYLLQRWKEGSHNGGKLWHEIQEQGFAYSVTNVCRFLAHLRREGKPPHPVRKMTGTTNSSARAPTTRRVAFLTIARRTELEEEDRAYLERLRADDAVVEQVYQLVQGFMQMLRGRQGERLDAWIEQAQDSGIDELRRFAAGLLMDHAAVHAGLTHVWSNGTVEGHVNRLKLLKRQMYGRQFRPAPPARAPRRLTDHRLTDQPGELPPVHRECGSSDLLYTSWQYRWPNNRRLASPEAMW